MRRVAWRVLLLALLTVPLVQCPYGAVSCWTAVDEGRPAGSIPPAFGQQGVAGVATAVAAAVVTGVVGCAAKQTLYRSAGGRVRTSANDDEPPSSSTAGTSNAFKVPLPWTPDADSEQSGESSAGTDDCWDSDDTASADGGSDDGGSDDGSAAASAAATPKRAAAKLWTKAQFPEGVRPMQANWDLANLTAAQEWNCPCTDRRNCIGAERGVTVLQLYDHRKQFLTTCNTRGGMRNAFRSDLQPHYSSASCAFSRSFVVGPLNDCCAASAGLAAGSSVQTYFNAYADVRKNRTSSTTTGARKRKRIARMSQDRSIIDAYIRRLRGTFEGAKGKDTLGWHTGRRSIPKRWEDFKKHRTQNALPLVGSVGIFREIWNSHTEIHEQGATGHCICDDCGNHQAVYDRLEGRTDAAANQQRREADEKKAQHDIEHSGERAYAEDIWGAAEVRPDKITAQNFDAPTVSQFDIPVQKRAARDVTKRLESMQKWGSKVTGVMTAGAGMLCFVARAGLGSGPNLSLTLLYLSLLHLVDNKFPLGSRYNILMDNTGGDNKNAETLCFLAWLVHEGVFNDASFFCQLKGHTFTVLDQSFNTMISQLLAQAIYTMTSLMSFMFKFLQPYGCQDVIEIHQLWDWKAAFKPHMDRIAGFCTGQYGAGMHECYMRKDSDGRIRKDLLPTHTLSSLTLVALRTQASCVAG